MTIVRQFCRILSATMEMTFSFFVNSALLGVGLSMDAFSISLANGLSEPGMRPGRMSLVSGVYAFFQAAMPLAGWLCVHTVVEYFSALTKLIPWIALLLLSFIGGKMIFETVRENHSEDDGGKNPQGEAKTITLTFGTLLAQGIATSLDALSVGFTIADYGFLNALTAALIIALVTFAICIAGIVIGKKAGARLSTRATIFGGVILIGIGIEIFVTRVFFS